jgi:hypothetical protein
MLRRLIDRDWTFSSTAEGAVALLLIGAIAAAALM